MLFSLDLWRAYRCFTETLKTENVLKNRKIVNCNCAFPLYLFNFLASNRATKCIKAFLNSATLTYFCPNRLGRQQVWMSSVTLSREWGWVKRRTVKLIISVSLSAGKWDVHVELPRMTREKDGGKFNQTLGKSVFSKQLFHVLFPPSGLPTSHIKHVIEAVSMQHI